MTIKRKKENNKTMVQISYLISYPRSGSTWLRCVLTSLISTQEISPDLVNYTIPQRFDLQIDSINETFKPYPTIFKSHAPFKKVPGKFIYLVRDGRDAILSHYYLGLKRGRFSSNNYMSPQEFLFWEETWPCQWHIHVSGWLNGLENYYLVNEYKIIRYEDLVKSPLRLISDISNFLGINCSQSRISEIVNLYTKSYLKMVENKFGEGSLYYIGNPRKQWQEIIDKNTIVKYEDIAGKTLNRLGYKLASDCQY